MHLTPPCTSPLTLCKLTVKLRPRFDLGLPLHLTHSTHLATPQHLCALPAPCTSPLTLCRLAVKLGPRYDMGPHLPKKEEGWTLAASGKDYAVWEKAA